ncbi:SEP-domain-containing protein [Hysterangium stoloniferum]|nr:SEP-domain-containing protein [Hysterangium stoloniferum]
MGPGPPGPGSFGGMDHGSDDEEEEAPEAEEDGAENWYAGGERSGLSIENPERRSGNNVVRDILRKAAEAGSAAQPSGSSSQSGPFSGAAYKLGSDEVESSFIPDPNAPQAGSQRIDEDEVATRHITFWRDGFSVEDGPLMRYDEPGNSQLLDEINAGHAPPHFLNVRIGQPVELRVTRRLNDDYVEPPKRPLGTFEGQGHRLGAPVPELGDSLSVSQTMQSIPGAFPVTFPVTFPIAPVERENLSTHFEVDQTLPTTSIQVRLADGTRLVARMNLHHTIGDIRNFINASRPGSSATPYAIQTTFPNRVLEDDSQTIEQAGLKNSVVVQRLL